MTPLSAKFEQLEELLLHHRNELDQNTGVPFLRLVYHPDEELECRRRRDLLQRTLEQAGVPVTTVTCRGAIFSYFEERDRLEQLFTLEQQGNDRLATNIATRTHQTLTNRLLEAASQLGHDGVIFLVETAFVYPYLHLAAILEDCTNKILTPQTLAVFYPGELDAENRLLFLGKRSSGYYRTRDLL